MDETLKCFIISMIFGIVIIVIISIKEKDNILTNLVELFKEWWQILKNIVPVLLIIVLLLVSCFGCTDTTEDNSETSEEAYEAYYKEGQKDAIEDIRKEANVDWKRYVEVEELEEILRLYFGDEADEIRDMIIYDPDLTIYESSDIVEEVINNTNFYYYDKSFKEKEQE